MAPGVDNRRYYDAFSDRYDRGRDRGYHALIDEQAAQIVARVGRGKSLLEVGCGTGLVLQRTARFASAAVGVDLSPGMLEHARARGLDVREGSATELPFDDAAFDVAYAFKVLAHIPQLDRCLSEMLRVVRPRGHIVFDAYNRHSLRFLVKRAFGPRATSGAFDESAIMTRFDTPREVMSCLPPGSKVVGEHGIRITTVHPLVYRLPGVARLAARIEWALMDSSLWRWAGFMVFTVEKAA